jgi:hypothetical protein
MNLLEALAAQPKRGTACRWNIWFESIPVTDQNAIRVSFADHNITTSHIARTLRQYGCPMSEATVRTHRLNECKSCSEH